MSTGYTIFPLGDSAATIDLGNTINAFLNDKIIAMQQWMLTHPFAGQKDIIVAYSALTIIYDPLKSRLPGKTAFECVQQYLHTAFNQSTIEPLNQSPVIRIPVCYHEDYALDIQAMAMSKQTSIDEIIKLHTAATYRVYAIGFLPGFSYMAEVHEKLIMPRKLRPAPVPAGSIGIAGAQTGIYPLNSPGGWHIIGRTPIKQFDANDKDLVKLKVGDRVQFYPITKKEMQIGWLQEGLIG